MLNTSIDDILNDVIAETVLNKSASMTHLPDIVEWAQERFYVIETGKPIQLMPHQKDILRLFTERREDGKFRWTTCLYSTIKKSGKTTISGLYGRWAAECWGRYQEIYNLGNKEKQAKDRAFKAIKRSIELAPEEIRAEWELKDTKLIYKPNNSFIEALPISGEGEAGGNQSLTIWTELWGFQYDDALLMWEEMKPVPTRQLSQRFIDTYAGFEGVSLLLKGLWDAGLMGTRLHDELPVFGNEEWGLIAYIDTGEEARRMPWQQGEMGEKYYTEQEASESEAGYQRHHLNWWASPQGQFIDIAMWDRLEDDYPIVDTHKIDVVLAVDGSVSSDCTALGAITYDRGLGKVIELETFAWEPPLNGKIDYDYTLLPKMDEMREKYRVVLVAYDEYQLHQTMTHLSKQADWRGVEFYAFPQGVERVKADTALREIIKAGELVHSGNAVLKAHLQNADAKVEGQDGDNIRIVKRDQSSKKNVSQRVKEVRVHIDAVIVLSMGAWKAVELLAHKSSSRVARQMATKNLWRSKR